MEKIFNRKDLKSNFLKTTIVRIDYDYLFEDNMENIVKNLNTFLISKDFKMNSKILNEYKINIDGNQIQSNETSIDVNKISSIEQFSSFISKDQTVIIDITKKFTTITINYDNNKSFEEISEIFDEIINQIKLVREELIFNRIGVRKINIFYLKNIENINKYFEECLFNYNNIVSKSNFTLKKQLDNFIIDNYNVNQNSEIQLGIYTDPISQSNSNLYRIILDIDIYKENPEKEDINLLRMNSNVFKIYISNLKNDFLNELKKENYNNEELIKLWKK